MANYQWNPLTDEKNFEDLINDLCSKKYGIEFQIYGRKGQKQYGIDGSALTADKKHILHQCKNKMISRSDSAIQSELLKDLETETVSMLSEFIEKKGYILDKFIFANSFKRDTKLQDKATELSVTHGIVVIVWSWDEISDMLEEYTDIAQKYYPQNFNKNSNKLPPQLTTKLGKSTLIGREKELQEIDEQLKASKTLLVKGIGGVGKSTIVSNYLHRHKDEYDYYGFFEGLESFESQLELAFKLEIEQGQDRLDMVLHELRNLNGNKLLVIDDVKNIEENQEKLEKILGLEHNGYRVLLTSREEIENVKQYDLDVLFMDDAKELFNSIHRIDDEVLLEEILEKYLDFHALFIEMTAKTLNIKKRTLSLNKLISQFRNRDFTKIKRDDIKSYHKFLDNFSINDIVLNNEENLLFIKKISILPSIEISFEKLYEVLGCDDEDKLEDFLIVLVRNGWLIEFEDGYKLHQILQDYILDKYPSSFEDMETIVDSLNTLIGNSAEVQIAVDNRENIVYFESLVSSLKNIDLENEKLRHFFANLGLVYYHLGFYSNAELFLLVSLKIHKKLLGEEHLDTATSYNDLAILYRLVGEYEEAELLYLKSLDIREKILGEYDPYIVQSYNNLASLYTSMEKYKKAKSFYLRALKMSEKFGREEHSNIATLYNNLASLYGLMGEYEKVEQLYLKALNIWEKVLGREHLNIAKISLSLGSFYYLQENFEKAYYYTRRAVNIWSKVFPEEYPTLVETKEWLNIIEGKLNNK